MNARTRTRLRHSVTVPAALAFSLLQACSPDPESPAATQGNLAATLPATFSGILPCADCPGIEYHLDLLAGDAFLLKRNFLERDGDVDEIGSFSISPDGNTLAIWGQGETPTQFRIVDADTLRLLDRNGNDIVSGLNYELRRAAEFSPTSLTLSLHGMYSYMADAARLVECDSGLDLDVAIEADSAALERAYLAARRTPGDALLASLDGTIALREPAEGNLLRPTVVVTRFDGIWPAETCGARMSRSELLGTNWVLTRLGDEAIVVTEGMQQARMVLSSTDDGVTGYGGCNNFNGSVRIEGNSISFGPVAATRRACAEGGDTEARLFESFDSVTRLELLRHHLELFDAAGTQLARFEARALP